MDSDTSEKIRDVISFVHSRTLSIGVYSPGDISVTNMYEEAASDLAEIIQQEIAKARRSERLEVALDNYRGQTFSESTDYKSKFDKFVRNNEIRIEQLTLKEHKEQ